MATECKRELSTTRNSLVKLESVAPESLVTEGVIAEGLAALLDHRVSITGNQTAELSTARDLALLRRRRAGNSQDGDQDEGWDTTYKRTIRHDVPPCQKMNGDFRAPFRKFELVLSMLELLSD